MFNEILVAVKFSAAGAQALKMAVQLAGVHAARLHVFHALDYRLKELEPNDPDLIDRRKQTEARFETEFHSILGDHKKMAYAVYPADPGLEVCKLANDLNADLIVLGCHQRREIAAMGRLDYVGMTILEKAPCPVMLVPTITKAEPASAPDRAGQ